VKWFNAEKGFGFVSLTDGSGDVFLHVNALQEAGYKAVNPVATLQIRLGNGQKGRQVDQVISVDETTADVGRPARLQARALPRHQVERVAAVAIVGTVKWYNPKRVSALSVRKAAARMCSSMRQLWSVLASVHCWKDSW
jgi:CspA family cold shock protein